MIHRCHFNPLYLIHSGALPSAIRCFFVLLMWIVLQLLFSQYAVASSLSEKNAEIEPLWKHAQYLRAPAGHLRIDDVVTHSGFTGLKRHAQFGQTDDHTWIKVSVDHLSFVEDGRFTFGLEHTFLDNLELYRHTHDGIVQKIYHVGDVLPYDERPFDYRGFILPITDHKPGDTYYFHAWSVSSMILTMYIGSDAGIFQRANRLSLFSYFISGIILAMLIYNLFLYFGTRISAYGWYVFYVGNVWLYTVFASGLGYQYLWSDSPTLQNTISYLSVAGFQWASFNFARSFLRMEKYLPKVDKWFLRISYFPLLLIVIIFISKSLAFYLLSLITLTIVATIPTVSLIVWRRGFVPSLLFLISWIFVVAGMLIYNLMLMGVLPVAFITTHALEMGVALESILLSFALAYRIRSMELLSKSRDKESRNQLERAYAETESALSMAKASNEAKNAFLSNISHNVKTPIHAFYGNIQLLSGSELDDSQKDKLEAAKDNAMQLFFYMDNLLTYSEILGNDIVPIESKTNVKNEIDEIIESWQKNNAEEGYHLDVFYSSSVPNTTYAEWIHARKVLRVLFDSLIPISSNPDIQIRVSAEIDEKEGSIVIDIDQLQLPDNKVLDNWVKEEIAANEWEGLGLEYYVGRKLIEVLGARLTYTQTEQRSCLTFEFPCRIAKDQYARESRTSFPNVNVLVVDDNKVNVQVMCAMLSKLGATAEAAESGEEAIEKVKTGDYDVILMDCLMPGVSGQETARRIRKIHSSNQNCPIIAVSANASDKDRESCLNAGMNDFMSKPVRVEKLAKFLTHWVPEY